MIVGLCGKILKKEPMFVALNVNGVIYGIQMSLNGTQELAKYPKDAEVHIICSHIIREDAHLLFGFCEEIEKQSFERLIKINGVGPKVALAILSTYTAEEFASIVQNKDISALQKVPGIGAKNAGKILVDIAGFFENLIQTPKENNQNKQQATLALQSLGFKASEITKALQDIESDEVSQMIKQALKKLS